MEDLNNKLQVQIFQLACFLRNDTTYVSTYIPTQLSLQ
jgi:hypothetical protein